MTEALIRKPKQLHKSAKTERAVYAYMYFNPGATIKQAAKDLKLSYEAARKAWERVKQHYDLSKLCPICFHETLINGVCHNCGFEDNDHFEYQGHSLEFSEPAYTILPHNGLGTKVDYSMLKLKYGATNIAHLVEHDDDRTLETLKSMLLEELKMSYPDPNVTNLAARILKREYERFKTFYPDLISKHGFNAILIDGVMKELKRWLP